MKLNKTNKLTFTSKFFIFILYILINDVNKNLVLKIFYFYLNIHNQNIDINTLF